MAGNPARVALEDASAEVEAFAVLFVFIGLREVSGHIRVELVELRLIGRENRISGIRGEAAAREFRARRFECVFPLRQLGR